MGGEANEAQASVHRQHFLRGLFRRVLRIFRRLADPALRPGARRRLPVDHPAGGRLHPRLRVSHVVREQEAIRRRSGGRSP